MKIAYIVYKSGIYNQGTYGVFDFYIEAKEHMEYIKSLERDDYHDFYTEPFLLNTEYIEPIDIIRYNKIKENNGII